jgi:hypothetical protein
VALLAAGAARAADLPDIAIDDTDVYPESLSSTKDGTLYIGSVKGILFRALPGQLKAEPWIQPTAENGLLAVLGVLADEHSHTLWVCSSPSGPLRNPPAVGTASVVAFDLKSGAFKGSYPFPAPAGACNDITIAQDGTAYVSDTPNGRILRLAPRANSLTVWAQDERLKGIDGIVFAADQTLYLNIVSRGQLMRVERTRDGSAGAITELQPSQPVAGPDGLRLVAGHTFLLAENIAGRIDQVTITGDQAQVTTLRDGLNSPPGVTRVGHTAYAIEGKIGYLIDPKLKGHDPGPFVVHAIPLPQD